MPAVGAVALVRVLHRRHVAHDRHARRVDRHDEHRGALVAVRVGVGDRHDDQEVGHRGVGGEPLVAVDDPLVAVLRPRSSGAASGRCRRVSGSVIEKAERRSPASSGCSHCSFWSSVPASASTSELPESGAWLPNATGANGLEPRISCMQAELDLAEALAAELGRQVGGPQAALAHLLLQRRDRAHEAVLAELLEDGLDRPDLLAHEVAHPVELRLELGLGGEVPRHRTPILRRPMLRRASRERREARVVRGRRRPRALMPLVAAAAVAAGAALQSATGFGFSDRRRAAGVRGRRARGGGRAADRARLAGQRPHAGERAAPAAARACASASCCWPSRCPARWPASRCCGRSTRSRCRSR